MLSGSSGRREISAQAARRQLSDISARKRVRCSLPGPPPFPHGLVSLRLALSEGSDGRDSERPLLLEGSDGLDSERLLLTLVRPPLLPPLSGFKALGKGELERALECVRHGRQSVIFEL